MTTARTSRLKQLQSMKTEELIGTIIYLEGIIKIADQRVKAARSFSKRMAQMHIIPESSAVDFEKDSPNEKTSTAREELLKKAQDDFNIDAERFFKKKADKHSTTITIKRSASRLATR